MSETVPENPAAPTPVTAAEQARDVTIFLFVLGAIVVGIGIWVVFANRVHAVVDVTGAPTVAGSAVGVNWGEVIAAVGSLMVSVPLVAWAVAMGIRLASDTREPVPYVPRGNPWEEPAKS